MVLIKYQYLYYLVQHLRDLNQASSVLIMFGTRFSLGDAMGGTLSVLVKS